MECCKASQFSNDAGARIWQAADVGYLALQYGAWLTWACLTLQLSSPLLLQESSHLVPLLLQESSLHFLSFFVKTFLVYLYNYRTRGATPTNVGSRDQLQCSSSTQCAISPAAHLLVLSAAASHLLTHICC